jgi:hypothetical protein
VDDAMTCVNSVEKWQVAPIHRAVKAEGDEQQEETWHSQR